MTEEEAMAFIDTTYIKYIGIDIDSESYLDSVITILNKFTDSNLYEIVFIKNIWTILKNKQTILEWKNYDDVGLVKFLNNEILLFKLEMVSK